VRAVTDTTGTTVEIVPDCRGLVSRNRFAVPARLIALAQIVPARMQPLAARAGRFQLVHQPRGQVGTAGVHILSQGSGPVLSRHIGMKVTEILNIMEEPVAQREHVLLFEKLIEDGRIAHGLIDQAGLGARDAWANQTRSCPDREFRGCRRRWSARLDSKKMGINGTGWDFFEGSQSRLPNFDNELIRRSAAR
jgi:hypothetical protein